MTRLVSIFTLLLVAACSNEPGNSPGADLILHNARIHTVNEQQPWADALVISDGRIAFVGNNETALEFTGENTEVVDLEGKLVLPGFQDAHEHPLEGSTATTFMSCDLFEISSEDPNPENWLDSIRPCADEESIHGWVLGWGHSSRYLMNLDRQPREILDDAFPDIPAAFMERSSHSIWVNSRGLEVAGIMADTPHPQGGKIFKDPDTGVPTGILADSAGDELLHKILAKTPALQEARYTALLISQDMVAQHGITSVANARVYWDRGNLEPWLRGEREGTLKSRSIQSLWVYPHMDDAEQIDKLKSMYRNDKESLLRLSQVKFYSDGVSSLNSAATLEPYGVLVHRYADPTGGNYFTEERMTRYIMELEHVGFGAVIHAIGDRAVRESLNAIENAAKANPNLAGNQRRHYISHVGWVHPDDIPRFAELNVPADTQINSASDGYEESSWRRSEFYQQLMINNKSDLNALPELVESGARIILSSDWDVNSVDPLVSIHNAVPQFREVMSVEEIIPFAVKAYTLDAAWAMDQEDITGSIEHGKYADLVILDRNIFEMPPRTIKEAKVLVTYLGGQEVYRADRER